MKYFVADLPVTTGNDTRLYTDGQHYCADLYAALRQARQFVFLTGLHFMPEFRLVRQGVPTDAASALVNVLAELGARGVAVYLLVNQFWKDESEIRLREKWHKALIAKPGELYGYLPETFALFEALKRYPTVHCRTDVHPHPIFGTHHQKTIVIDDRVCFLGGIDLTFLDGDRWDTHAHSTALRAHERTQKYWHDVHMRLVGPAVEFVRDNFIERWMYGRLHTLRKKAMKEDRLDDWNMHMLGQEFIIEAVRDKRSPTLPRFAYKRASVFTYPADTETPDKPTVQIVRSIPNTGTFQIIKRPWHKGKGAWDRSCKDAYLTGLRAAQRYIYLENQWVADEDIWTELIAAAKRHRGNADFRIILMVPYEGLFAAGMGSNQELWIGAEMRDLISASHSDKTFGMYGMELTKHTGASVEGQIYVHSKVLIVDDEWSLIGSANAGGISLEGVRTGRDQPDTELSAIILDKAFASAFRQQLWSEHLGVPVQPGFSVKDADEFRRQATRAPRHKMRFYPSYLALYNKKNIMTAPWAYSRQSPLLSMAPFQKQSRIISSFPRHFAKGLAPALTPAGFRAYVVPAVPAGYRCWYRWHCDLLGASTGDTVGDTADDTAGEVQARYRLRSARLDTELAEYSDQDAVYLDPRTSAVIDHRLVDMQPARISCRVQCVPLGQDPDEADRRYPSLLLTWDCSMLNSRFARANHPNYVGSEQPELQPMV